MWLSRRRRPVETSCHVLRGGGGGAAVSRFFREGEQKVPNFLPAAQVQMWFQSSASNFVRCRILERIAKIQHKTKSLVLLQVLHLVVEDHGKGGVVTEFGLLRVADSFENDW